MVLVKYYLKFKDEGWTEVGSLVQSSNTSPLNVNLCSTAWLSTINTATFTLKYNGSSLYHSMITKLISAQSNNDDVYCKVTDNSNVVMFYGIVDFNKIELTSAKIPQTVSITANDHMKLLDKKIDKNKIFKVGETMKSVVEWLLSDAGSLSVESWNGGSDLVVLETPVVFTEDDSTKYLDAVNTILQELGGYVLVSTPSNQKFNVEKIVPTTVAGQTIPTVHYMVSSKLKSGSSLFTQDGVVVKYKNVKTSGQELVYMQNISISDGTLEDPSADYDDDGDRISSSLDGTKTIPLGEVVPVGGYYPLDSDITKTYQEYDSSLFDYSLQQKKNRKANEDLGIYYVDPNTVVVKILASDKDGNDLKATWYENVDFHSTEGKFDYKEGGEFHPKKAWQIFHNKLSECVNVQSFIIEGVTVFSDRQSRLVMPMDCKDPYEYESSYISTKETADALAVLLTNLKKYGGDTSTWTAPWSTYSLGQEVYVEHPSATKVKAIIVKKTMKVIGTQMFAEYVAVHNGNWETSQEYVFASGSNSAPSYDPYVQAVASGFNGTRNDFIVSQTTLVEYAIIPDRDNFGSGLPYGDGDGAYGFSADDEFGEEYEWTTGQIDQSTLEPGEYIWMRTSTDGGATWRYTRLTGAEAQVFNLHSTSMTYNINRRAGVGENNQPITISTEISGYRSSAVITCTTDSSLLSSSGVLTIPLNTAYTSVVIVATLEGADSKRIELKGVDVTEYGSYFGANATEEGALNGNVALDGDVYYNTSTGKVMLRSGGRWIEAADSIDASKKAEAYSKAQKDVLSVELDGVTKSEKTVAYYGYFEHVVANTVNANLLNAINIENNYGPEDSDGYPTSGYRIDGPNGTIKSYNSKFSNAHFKQADIDSSSNFYGTIKIAEKDSPDSPVLETVTIVGDEDSVISTSLLTNGDKYYKGSDLIAGSANGDYQSGSRTIVNNSGSSYSGTVLLYEGSTPKQRTTGSINEGATFTNPYPFKTVLSVNNTNATVAPNGTYKIPATRWNPQYEFFGVGSALDGVSSSFSGGYYDSNTSQSIYLALTGSNQNTGSLNHIFKYVIGKIGNTDVVGVAYVSNGKFARAYTNSSLFLYTDDSEDGNHEFSYTVPFTTTYHVALANGRSTSDDWKYSINGGSWTTVPGTASSLTGLVFNVSLNAGDVFKVKCVDSSYSQSGASIGVSYGFSPSDVGITGNGMWYLAKGSSTWLELPDSVEKATPVSISAVYSYGLGTVTMTSTVSSYQYVLKDSYSQGFHLLNSNGNIVKTIGSNEFFKNIVKPEGGVPSTAWYKRGALTKDGNVIQNSYPVENAKGSTIAFTSSSYGTLATQTDKVTYANYVHSTGTLTVKTLTTTYEFTSSELFTYLSLSITVDSGLVGIKTANIEAVSESNTIGKLQRFGAVYSKAFHGETFDGKANTAGRADSADSCTGNAATASNASKLSGMSTTSNGATGIPFIRSDGVMEVGKYIDFHLAGGDTSDYKVRLTSDDSGNLSCSGNFSATNVYGAVFN